MTERASLPGEQWASVPGHSDYEVSSEGRVWSRPRPRVRGGLLSPYTGSHGYLMTKLNDRNWAIHKLVALAFLGPCPPGMEVRHLDGDRQNARLTNLAYGTKSENRRDRFQHGTDHNLNKTHCPQGHPYDEANTDTILSRPAARYCRECRRRHTREYMRRKRAQA